MDGFIANFAENWADVARSLDVSSERILRIRKDLVLNIIGWTDAAFEILEEWVLLKGSEAKLDLLLDALADSGLSDYAGKFAIFGNK